MTVQPECPRCGAFVPPEWPRCRICGFDPDRPGHWSPPAVALARPGVPLRNVAGALATVIVAAGVLVGSVAGVRYLWEHLTGRSDHQDYVIVER